MVKVSLKIPSKNRLQGDFLWGVAPNPTCFLKKASQKLYLPSAWCTLVLEELFMPYQEHIYCPDLTAIIGFASLMIVQIFHDFFCLEVFLCRRAMEGIFDDIIVFGEWMPNERKGIHSVSLSGQTQFGCTTRTIDFNDRSRLDYKSNSEDTFKAMQPMFLKGEFDAEPGVDTYVEFSEFGHGYIFINGFNLGRFDSAGPMMTLYLPGALLKDKGNLLEIVDFAPKKFNPEIKLLDKHLLEGDAEHLK
ncbi:MAG: hypothetical protein IIU70_01235 [Anaerotignum sp.]|nr:hypothetical protein [Anaerotignum sp.]